jgi:two-component system cell cycle sensor histidine kinase/response regulator CckA
VSVSSAPEKGSTFTIHLPCVDAPLETEREIVQPTVRSGVETILLVEDDPQVRTLAKAVLVRKGYIVIDASDAEDALRLAAQQTGPLDLLLTDVMMPGMNGRLLVEKMSERYPGLRVLYMSGYTDDAIVQYGVVTSGVAFLQKPFTPAALARAVREVLDQGTSGGGSFTKNQ